MDLTNINKDRKTRRRTENADLSTIMYGKIPPQARDLEDAVLGAIMLHAGAFDTVAEILKPACFYVDANQRIFQSMFSLQNKNMPIDLLTVVEELKSLEELDMVGGPYYVSKLTNAVVSHANIEAHSRIIMQKFIQRELIRISGVVIGDAYEDSTDCFELLDRTEQMLYAITFNHLKNNYINAQDGMIEVIKTAESLRHRSEELTGINTGFKELNRVTNGWQDTDLIILAARPSVGKTALALNLAENADEPVGFFSLEMSTKKCLQRIISSKSGVYLDKIMKGRLDEEDMKKLIDVAKLESKIYIDDTTNLSIYQLRAKARAMKTKHGIKLLIVDYLQLMDGIKDEKKYTNREQEISKISRDLKGLAKELNIPVIALSQLSREVEKRKEGNKMPQLSDLRESGALEQDADLVAFIYRPEYYGIHANELGENNQGETRVKIAKHRNGVLETIKLHAQLYIQKFTDPEEDPFPVEKNKKDEEAVVIPKTEENTDYNFMD